VLLQEFTENIYAISFDGSLAVGTTKVFNSANGIAFTNFSFSSRWKRFGDQKKLFRYNSSGSQLVVYDMAAIAPVSGPAIVPTPADGAVVSLPLTNLVWSVSPIALAYDVYFGTNQTQVATAGIGAAQYLGRTTGLSRALTQPLAAGTIISGAWMSWVSTRRMRESSGHSRRRRWRSRPASKHRRGCRLQSRQHQHHADEFAPMPGRRR